MFFADWHAVLLMDNHGIYVWSVYLIATIIFLWNIWKTYFLYKKAQKKIKHKR